MGMYRWIATSRRHGGFVAATLFLTAGIGCGHKLRTYPVEGVVVWSDGKPAVELAGGFVTVDSVELNVSSQGVILSNGTFTLGTYGKDDGVPAGTYRASVTRPPDVEITGRAVRLPSKYENVARSGLVVMVEPKPNSVTLKLDRGGKPSAEELGRPADQGL
jgi:hypothetical protein